MGLFNVVFEQHWLTQREKDKNGERVSEGRGDR